MSTFMPVLAPCGFYAVLWCLSSPFEEYAFEDYRQFCLCLVKFVFTISGWICFGLVHFVLVTVRISAKSLFCHGRQGMLGHWGMRDLMLTWTRTKISYLRPKI